MKKITKFLSLIISAIILVACPATVVAGVSAADETVNYTADFSGGVPSDWAAYSNGDGKGYVEEGDNGIVVVHNNGSANAGNYYGGIFEIATGIGNVRDFELVMDFNFVQWNNDSRWFGVLYHTQKNSSNKLEGYMMNVRANGESAQSSVTTVPSFTDTERVSCGKTLTDKKTHTLKITVENGIATHYVDNFKLISYALESKYALMSGVLVDGGFAFIANNCSVQITSLTIKGTKGGDKPTKVKADETLADTYASATSLVVAPSVVTTVKNQEDINALLEDVIPATAIFSVDDEMNVVDENGENLGAFDDIYTNVLVGKIIPAIYVRSEAQVNGFLNYLATIRNLLDIAVVSDDAELVAYARKSNTKIRGIVDYSNKNLKAEDIPNVVSESNVSGANIVIFNEETATRANVTYAHSRFKAVWVVTNAQSEFEVAALVSTGCFGIVTPNVEVAYETYKNYTQGYSLARTPFNIAHRGLCATNYENSLEAFVEAYEKGATHIEIDVQMSKDGHLVVMHDASINRTTNGAGNVSGLTLAQLANFKITKNTNGVVLGEGVAIPTLRDVFEALAGTDLIFVVEIKTGDLTTASKLKALVEEFDCLDQVVVIAFGVAQLERFKTDFPEVPTANLNNISTGSFASALHSAGSYNSVIDTHYNNVNEYFTSHDLRDRGFLGYYWTYGNYGEIASKFGTGVVGMTNNAADSIGYYPKELVVKSGYVIANRKTWKTRDLTATTITYDGQETDVLARVFMTDEREDGNYVILSYRFTSKEGLGKYTLFTEPVKVIFEDEFIAPSDIVSRIDALPSDITLENGNEIRALRRAYDALPLSEQALVTNISKLVGHEKTLGRLEALNNSSSVAPSTSETPSQNSSGASSGSGCKSSVAGSAMGVMLLVCAMAVVLKRKN